MARKGKTVTNSTPMKPPTAEVIMNSAGPTSAAVQNGLAEAVGFNPFNYPQGSGIPGTEQLSSPSTMFKNLRWYLVSNMRQVLAEIYVELGLVQTIVDVPVDDALRGGVEIKSQQLDEDQIQELQTSLRRDRDLQVIGQAAKWSRLFGGGAVIIMTDQDPEEELDLEAIGTETPLEFRAVDMWELYWDAQNVDGTDLTSASEEFEFYTFYGVKIHKSRVMRLKGFEAPSYIRPRLRGWGVSVCEVLVRSVNQYLKATDLGFEVLDEFKLDVYKIKNLVNTLLSPNGQQKIQNRIQIANYQKNYQHAVVMDSEDDFDHKQLSFAGLAEAMAGIRMQVAADLRMPITKLFGQSVSGGIGNNDQNDMENYNSMVESQIRSKIEFDVLRLCEIKCQKLFGMIPDDLSLEFKPLRVLTAVDEENVKTQKFNRVLQAKAAGEISTFEFREACNKGNLLDITLDTKGDALNPDDPEVEAILEGEREEDDAGGEIGEDGEEGKDPPKGKKGAPGKTPEKTTEPKNKETPNKETDNKQAKNKEPKVNNDGWDEGKHPRADDGKFGSGGGGSGDSDESGGEKAAPKSPVDTEISKLLEEAEKADDSNSHHKAEALREKARKLEKSKPKEKAAPKTVSEMTVGELKKRKEGLRKKSSELTDKLIDAGFGDLKSSDMRERITENPLFAEAIGYLDALGDITSEAESRGGPGIRLEQLDPKIHKPKEKKKNSERFMQIGYVAPFTTLERIERVMKNSAAFDRASYEADGGDAWIHPGREEIFRNPMNVDQGLWAKAKEASQAAFGKEKWQFVVWFYKKQGGKF